MRSRGLTACACALLLVGSACGGGGGGDDDDAADDSGIVISQDQLDEALGDDDSEIARVEADDDDTEGSGDTGDPGDTETDGADQDTEDDDELTITEVEEDPLDGLLNSLTLFNQCLDDSGYALDGFPGDGSGRGVEDFDDGYLSALVSCNAESGIQDAATSFGEAQANRTPEEIAQTNFGLPFFKECLEDLGWAVGELTPGTDGALGFGAGGTELTPPDGGGFGEFNTDDIDTCRRDAEDYTAANYESGDAEES